MGKRWRCWLGITCRAMELASCFLKTPCEVISEEYTSDYSEAMWECVCVIASLRLSWGIFRNLWILGVLMLVVKKTGMKQSEWVKHTPPWCWPYMLGTLCVDVPGKYTLGSGTDYMLNEVQRQVIKCTCVMGPCRRTLSWSNFKRVNFEIIQAGFKLE